MRILIAMFLTTASISSMAQREEIIQVPGVSVNELYKRSDRWFIDNFRDANSAVQLRDTAEHTIVAKGNTAIPFLLPGGTSGSVPFLYSMEVACKEERCRVRIYDVTVNSVPYENDTCCAYLGWCAPEMPTKLSGAQRSALKTSEQMRQQVCPPTVAIMDKYMELIRAALLRPKEDW